MSFQVRVDPTNPGQFFACCGLFELAARLDGAGARAHFAGPRFVVEAAPTLGQVLDPLVHRPLAQVDDEDETASPIDVPAPFGMRLDWWKDQAGGRELKVWAGTMQGLRIAQAMLSSLRDPALHTEGLFDVSCVVYDPENADKKVEPFYFDARRAPNAHSRDVGFSPNDLDMTTAAFPAVEALCLIGLQRFRPSPTDQRRVFDYRTWATPLAISVAAPVISGAVVLQGVRTYRFECWFRTGQKKHKAFRPAVPVV